MLWWEIDFFFWMFGIQEFNWCQKWIPKQLIPIVVRKTVVIVVQKLRFDVVDLENWVPFCFRQDNWHIYSDKFKDS